MGVDRNIIYGTIAILLWSATVALVRSITKKMNAFQAGTYTFAGSGVGCLFIVLIFNDVNTFFNFPIQYLIICGLLFVIYMVALFVAIEKAKNNQQALELGLINYLWPTLTVVLSLFILNRNVTLLIVPGIILPLLGIFFVITQQSAFSWKPFVQNVKENYIAYLLALIAAVVWALYSNLTNLLGNPGAPSAVFIFIPFTGIVFSVITLFSKKYKQSLLSFNPRTKMEMIAFSVFTILAYYFWDISMRRTNVTFVAVLSNFTPLFSTIIIAIYFKERINKKLWLGCFLIISGSIISWISIYK